ncbi:MAG: pyrroloquinoline quinone biosynthesis peptide chaperone PqqD [Rhodospirillales bacterium]|nr:MAG: pyrroloquinoline quinone biosynthesis peptide chaperone PqqD [Rhodospirillales bacterium]
MTADALGADSVPRLGRGVRLKDDAARGGWVLLAPERVLVLDDTAHAVLQRLDGKRTVRDIADSLAAEYDAPGGAILRDSLALLRDLAAKGLVKT